MNECVCERETERVPGCLHSLSCSLRGALSMSGSTYWSNSEPEWLSWLQGQSRKAAHKKKTGHRFYCFCALMSFFFLLQVQTLTMRWIWHTALHMSHALSAPHRLITYTLGGSSKCAGARGWKREVKKKKQKEEVMFEGPSRPWRVVILFANTVIAFVSCSPIFPIYARS